MVVPGELDHDVFTTKGRQLLSAERGVVQVARQPPPERESQESEGGGDGAVYGSKARVAFTDVMEQGSPGELTAAWPSVEHAMC